MFDVSQCIVEFPPEELDFEKWQELVNMLSKVYNAASGVIVQFRDDTFNVVSTSENPDNFLEQNSCWPWDMKSFCRRIMETRDKLYVNSASTSQEWCDAPPVQDGPVRSYLGYPLYWPDGSLFGSFCVIDTKATDYSQSLVEVLGQLKLIVESELKHVWDKQKIKSLLAEKLSFQEAVEQDKQEVALIKNVLEEQESVNTATLASLMEAVIRIDSNGSIISCNQATSQMIGFSVEEIIGANIRQFVDATHWDENFNDNEFNLDRGNLTGLSSSREFNAIHKDGSLIPVQMSITGINLGGITQYIYLLSDITENVQHQEILKQLALYDNLTNCANRNLLSERFKYERSKAIRHQSRFSLLFIDLNDFKPINDNLGHNAGDHTLKKIAKRLQSVVRPHDLVSRIGGDEFVILFTNDVSTSSIIDKIHHTISKPFTYEAHTLNITGSVGIATYPLEGETLEALLAVADKKMYGEKQQAVK